MVDIGIYYNMIVAKFGGTAITPNNLHFLKNAITNHHGAVVVSAIGKQYDGDTKVTDLLRELHRRLPDTSLFDKIAFKYRSLVEQNDISIGINDILQDTITDIVQRNCYENTLSKGEELSAKVVSAFLGWQYVGAESLFRFGSRSLLSRNTARNIRSVKGRFVTGGFYGAREDGTRVLFPRGGSDISAAIVAEALDATLYENWTDVNGLCVADPTKVRSAETVRCVSYSDMRLLAQCGATVLHPDSVLPVARKAIPINIRNYYQMSDFGTVVCNDSLPNQLLGVTSKKVDNLFQTTVVFTMSHSVVASAVYSLLRQHDIQPVSVIGASNYLQLLTSEDILSDIHDVVMKLT